MFKHILCPIDGSTCSLHALDAAAHLAREEHSRLTICYVIDPAKAAGVALGDPSLTAPFYQALRREGDTMLTHAAVGVRANVQVETILLDGFVVETILEYAQKNDCDLIVMGSHGRGGFQRLLIGSVAEGVLRHSNVPVMIVRFREAESAAPARNDADVKTDSIA